MKHIYILEFDTMKQFHHMMKIKLSFIFMHQYRMIKQNHTSKNVNKKYIHIKR